MLAIPLVGTYVSYFIFGGDFPGSDFIPRLFTVHILLIPGIIIALITVHIFLVVVQKHSVAGSRPHAAQRRRLQVLPDLHGQGGRVLLRRLRRARAAGRPGADQPGVAVRPVQPPQITAGSQPDWYIGFMDGALQAMPNWESNILGHDQLEHPHSCRRRARPAFTVYALYPFIERWVTGDKREHHILDRPRDHPTRTGLGVLALTFYVVLLIDGGNDILAYLFGLSINAITWTTSP